MMFWVATLIQNMCERLIKSFKSHEQGVENMLQKAVNFSATTELKKF